MKTTEMVSPAVRPIHDQEGHIPFEPFTRREWAVTIVLALLCIGIPVGAFIQFHVEQARLNAAVLAEEKGGVVCPYRASFHGYAAPAGMRGSVGRSTARNAVRSAKLKIQ
jgi:hypothetical protein